jgi:hypothetical protein
MTKPARVDRCVQLYNPEWELIRDKHPDLALKMIRNCVTVVNAAPPSAWMRANFKGLFYIEGSNRIFLEDDEDSVLLTMKVSGQS